MYLSYLQCKPHDREFAEQFVDPVLIRWDHRLHKSMDEHFQTVGSLAGWPTDY